MTDSINAPRGWRFEDFAEGMALETRGRTISETDIVHFAACRAISTRCTPTRCILPVQFGQRVAHGLLGLAIASGPVVPAWLSTAPCWPSRRSTGNSARRFIGDTIRVAVRTKTRDESAGGALSRSTQVINQEDKVTQKGEWTVLIASRPAEAGE